MTHCMLCTTEDVYHTTLSYISTSARTVLALPLKNVQLTCGSILYSTSGLKWHTVCCVRLRTSVIPHFLIFPPVRGQSSHCHSKTYSWRVVVYYTRRLDWNGTLCAVYDWGRLLYHTFLYVHQCEDSPRIAATADTWKYTIFDVWTEVTLVLLCTVSEITYCRFLYSSLHPYRLFHPRIGGVPLGPDRPCWGHPEQKP